MYQLGIFCLSVILLGHPLHHPDLIPQEFLLLDFNTQCNFTAQFPHNYFISFLQGSKYFQRAGAGYPESISDKFLSIQLFIDNA